MITKAHVLQALSRHIGRNNGVHTLELVRECHALATPCGYEPIASVDALGRHIRDLIVELRNEGHHICGKPESGYFIAETVAELDATCEFIYQRCMTGLTQIAAMKRVSVPDLRGQLRLPLEASS